MNIKKYEVSITHEGGFFFADENNESCDGSQNHDILNLDIAISVYNANNYGLIELREYEDIDSDEYIILRSKKE